MAAHLIHHFYTITESLIRDYPMFKFHIEYITGSVRGQKLCISYERRNIASISIKENSEEYVSMGYHQIATYGNGKTEYVNSTESMDEFIKDTCRILLEMSLEYQHWLLTERVATLEKRYEELLYAPGGPMYQEAKREFESLKS